MRQELLFDGRPEADIARESPEGQEALKIDRPSCAGRSDANSAKQYPAKTWNVTHAKNVASSHQVVGGLLQVAFRQLHTRPNPFVVAFGTGFARRPKIRGCLRRLAQTQSLADVEASLAALVLIDD